MIKSRENDKKPVFPAYFRQFRPEKYFFRKSGSVTFWTLSFCVCAKFHEKISSTARDIQKILFFQKKSAFPAIFKKFQVQKSVLLTIESCLVVGIVINNVFVKKATKNGEKTRTKSAKTAIFGIFPPFSAKNNYFPKSDLAMFGVLLIRIFVQKIRKN